MASLSATKKRNKLLAFGKPRFSYGMNLNDPEGATRALAISVDGKEGENITYHFRMTLEELRSALKSAEDSEERLSKLSM